MSETISTEELNEEKITLATIVQILGEFRSEVNTRFTGLETRLDSLEKRLDTLEDRIGSLEKRMTNIEENIERIKLDIYDIRVRLDEVTSLTHEALMITYKDRTRQTLLETRVIHLDTKFDALRQKVELA